jgi:hypothetical protein
MASGASSALEAVLAAAMAARPLSTRDILKFAPDDVRALYDAGFIINKVKSVGGCPVTVVLPCRTTVMRKKDVPETKQSGGTKLHREDNKRLSFVKAAPSSKKLKGKGYSRKKKKPPSPAPPPPVFKTLGEPAMLSDGCSLRYLVRSRGKKTEDGLYIGWDIDRARKKSRIRVQSPHGLILVSPASVVSVFAADGTRILASGASASGSA